MNTLNSTTAYSATSTDPEARLFPYCCHVTQISEYIFLGDEDTAYYCLTNSKKPLLPKNIVSVIAKTDSDKYWPVRGIRHLKINAVDEPTQDLRRHFDETYRFIQRAELAKERILIHCWAGISRSATIVTAYFMRKHEWPFWKALGYISLRRDVHPNYGFQFQLMNYELDLWYTARRRTFIFVLVKSRVRGRRVRRLVMQFLCQK